MKKVNITMKKSFFVMATIATNFIFGQVGINNSDPKATLDVTAKNTNGSTAEGIIAPRLTGAQIQSGDAQYTALQTGTIVYATSASPGAATTGEKTININGAGYYYFDGSIWQKFNSGTAAAVGTEPWYDVATNTGATANTQDIYQMGKVGIGTNAPNASAVLDIVSTKGVLIPRMASNPAAPATGLLIYRTDLKGFYAWNGAAWTQTVFGGGLEPWFVQGTASTQATGNTQNIYQMGSVGIGTSNASAKLDIVTPTSGTGFRLSDGSEGAGKILTSDASGKASWELSRVIPRTLITGTTGSINDLSCNYAVIPGASITLPQGYWTIYIAGHMDGDGATNNYGPYGSSYFDMAVTAPVGSVTLLDGAIRKVPFVNLVSTEYGVSYRVFVSSATATFVFSTSACNVTLSLSDNYVTTLTALDN